jgi:glycosyltransferase involved in cell wall biosynthesis
MLTIIHPYYENPTMFRLQQQEWFKYPPELKKKIEFIVVDDGSPDDPAIDQVFLNRDYKLRLYRIKVDVRWNWLACRNLAAKEAKKGWLLLTDMDHMLRRGAAAMLVYLIEDDQVSRKCAYNLAREDAPGYVLYKPHPNTWLVWKGLYWKAGGYDETFSGYYGTDATFRRRIVMNMDSNKIDKNRKLFQQVPLLEEVKVTRYPGELVPDARTTRYERKTPEDIAIKGDLKRSVHRHAKTLTFPWERLI